MPESYRVSGRIRDEENSPVEGYTVQAFDKTSAVELHPDTRLGKSRTGSDGSFEMTFSKDVFKGWFENNPDVYIRVRDREGYVALETHQKTNTTGDVYFQVKLGETEAHPLAPDLYSHNFERIVANYRTIGDVVDLSQNDTVVISELLYGALNSWLLYRDEIAKLGGYDGIQVPEQPRRTAHSHVTRWDRAELPP